MVVYSLYDEKKYGFHYLGVFGRPEDAQEVANMKGTLSTRMVLVM